jgi:hypothetical protein
MLPLGFSLSLVILVPFAVAYFFPKTGAYVLGPAILAIAAVAFVALHDLFAPFRSDGSPAGLVVPAMMWFAFVVACIAGTVLVVTGTMRMRWRREASRAPPSFDLARASGARAWLAMFNVALGLNIAITTSRRPLGGWLFGYMLRVVDPQTLYRSLGAAGLQLLGFALSYLLPALTLCLVFRAAGLQRKLAFDARGSGLILAGNLGVLLFAIARIVAEVSSSPLRFQLRFVVDFHALVWLVWSLVPIGLFLLGGHSRGATSVRRARAGPRS